MTAVYTANSGSPIVFNDGGGYYLKVMDLRSYGLNAQLVSEKYAVFYGAAKSFSVSIGVKGDTAAQVSDRWERMLAAFDGDAENMTHGALNINGYTLKCFVIGCTAVTNLSRAKTGTFTVVTDDPVWRKDAGAWRLTPAAITPTDQSEEQWIAPQSYPREYPFGYPSPVQSSVIETGLTRPCNFVLTVFGAVTNPRITIGGKDYGAGYGDAGTAKRIEMVAGDELTIDSASRTITLKHGGNETNVFDRRPTDADTFAKLPADHFTVSIPNGYSCYFILKVIDERRLPPWSV